MGLNYYTSAGVITLLTLQDTVKETIIAAIKKTGTFFVSVVIAFVVFEIFDYTPLSYGIFLFIFIMSCYFIKMYETIPINAVLATHFLLEKNMSIGVISNEALLMVIGAGVGILLNVYIPSNIGFIRKEQSIIEKDFKKILNFMAEQIIDEDKSSEIDNCLDSLGIHISRGIKQAYANMNNTFFHENRYFIDYMELRNRQYKVLQELTIKIKTLSAVPSQAYEVSSLIKELSASLSESQKAKGMLVSLEELLIKFKDSSLPVTREEFENRAVLYMILMDFKMLIKMKENFADSLTQEQINLYWRE